MYFTIFCPLFVLTLTKSALALQDKATIQILKRREQSAEDHGYEYDYDVSVSTFDTTHRLKLRAAESILSPDFRYHEVETSPSGQPIFIDLTPTPSQLGELEENLYIDVHKRAALRLTHFADGDFKLEGHVNGVRIQKQNGGQHYSESPFHSNTSSTVDRRRRNFEPQLENLVDVDVDMDNVTESTPELLVVFDYENSKLFNFNRTLILEYITILFNSVNNDYASNVDPKISFRLVGVHIIKTLEAQPFIENSKEPGENNTYNITKMLQAYSIWVAQNKDVLPKHDMAPLIFGVETSTHNGLSPVGGACWMDVYEDSNSSEASPVSKDIGGYFAGASTVSHELAHNMGAHHDGDDEAKDCPQGYIMRSAGAMSKLSLSACSQKLIKDFMMSTQGACLLQTNPTATLINFSQLQTGDKVNITQFCRKYMDNSLAVEWFRDDPNSLCVNVTCMLPGGNRYVYTGARAGFNAPCGEGGKCQYGRCVGEQRSRPFTLDALCVRITGKEGARARLGDPNRQCSEAGFWCELSVEDGGTLQHSMMKPRDGTPCGNGGKCKQKHCNGQTGSLTMDQMCEIIGDKKGATIVFQDPNIICAGGFWCNPEDGGKMFPGVKPWDGTPCGDSGECQNNTCVGAIPMDFNRICAGTFRNSSAKALDFGDYDGMCTRFNCKLPNGTSYNVQYEDGYVPSGTLCGNGGACKGGRCVGAKYAPLLTMDELCVRVAEKEGAIASRWDEPNDQCATGFWCELHVKDGGTEYWGMKPRDCTPCGEGGKCMNGSCIVDGQGLNLDQLCGPKNQVGTSPTEISNWTSVRLAAHILTQLISNAIS